MTQYAIVEAASGRIVAGWGRPDPEGYTGDPDWRPLPHDGLIYMPWQGSLLLGDQPAPTADLLWQDKPVWVDAAPLLALKARKNAEINQWRAAANQSTFPYADKLIACDPLSRSDIDGVANHISLFGEFPPNFPMAWKALDNTYVSLPDVAAFKAMYQAMTAQGTANFERSQVLKVALGKATDAAEVAAIAW